jgi:hypothetical protein
MTEWKPEKNISSPWDVDVWENNIGQPVLNTSNKPTDTEILEFLLNQFQMHSPKMNGQHSWRFMNDYCMKFAVGPSARDAVIACMKAQK